MTSTGNDFFTWVQEIIQGVSPFQEGTNFVVMLVLALIICIAISPRKPKNITTLIFPVMVGMTSIGLTIPLLFLALGAIIFIMDVLSLNVISGIIETVGQTASSVVSGTTERFGKVGKIKRDVYKSKLNIEGRKARKEPLSITDAIKRSEKFGRESDRFDTRSTFPISNLFETKDEYKGLSNKEKKQIRSAEQGSKLKGLKLRKWKPSIQYPTFDDWVKQNSLFKEVD